jgi:hypothetical protein
LIRIYFHTLVSRVLSSELYRYGPTTRPTYIKDIGTGSLSEISRPWGHVRLSGLSGSRPKTAAPRAHLGP